MDELSPLLSSSQDALELELLRSVDGDEPGPGALAKTAVALGVATTAFVGGSAAASAGAAANGAVAGPGALVAAGAGAGAAKAGAAGGALTAGMLLKWLSIGATAGLLTTGTAHVLRQPAISSAPGVTAATNGAAPQAPPTPTHGERSSVTEPPAPATVPAENAVASEPAAGPATPKALAAARAARGPAGEVSRPAPTGEASFEAVLPLPPPSPASTLGDETRALDRVRAALVGRRPADALAELEDFRRRWPSASLETEAAVLRVEALLGLGDRAGAERTAAGLIRVAPKSRHAARVRELLARK